MKHEDEGPAFRPVTQTTPDEVRRSVELSLLMVRISEENQTKYSKFLGPEYET